MFKKLTMLAGHRCSLQYHEKKNETIYVLSGVLRIVQGTNENILNQRDYSSGEFINIPAGVIH